jgi:hypothetical protein
MKNHIFILMFFINISCSAQYENVKIEGDWYNYVPSKTKKTSYVESNFDGDVFRYYRQDTGLRRRAQYLIENGNVKINLDNETGSHYLSLKLSNDILEMSNENIIMTYGKINDTIYTLDKYLNNLITEDQYFRLGFLKRKAIWEKSGTLSE